MENIHALNKQGGFFLQSIKRKLVVYFLAISMFNAEVANSQVKSPSQNAIPLLVRKCPDFTLTGKGDNIEWARTEWNYLTKLDSGGKAYTSQFKILYSEKGVYVLFYGDDDKISTRFDMDFGDLFKGDVFEVFFHTDTTTLLYLEYEINQLNKELVLLIPNVNGKAYGWIPWHYEKNRSINKMVEVAGGKKEANAVITSWHAELFFPYDLFRPLGNTPPQSGTTWNANFYRLDYDTGRMIKWAWGPVHSSFHELDKFRLIKFE